MAATITDTKHQLAVAVDSARHARHHQDCRCASYRRDSAPYCTSDEWRWCQMVDRLLTSIRR